VLVDLNGVPVDECEPCSSENDCRRMAVVRQDRISIVDLLELRLLTLKSQREWG